VPTLTNSARTSACHQASNQRGDDLAKRLADDALLLNKTIDATSGEDSASRSG